MKMFMSWRSRVKTQKEVEKGNAAAAPCSSCPARDSFIVHSTEHALVQEHLQTSPDHDQRLRGARPIQPVDDEQQPAWALPHHSAHDHIDKLCPQNIYSPDLLRYRKLPVEQTSDLTSSSTKDYDLDLLVYQYTLQNELLSIGTLGGELLVQSQTSETENHKTSSSLDYIVAADLEDRNAREQHFLKLINGDSHANENLVNAYHEDMKTNNSMALYIENGLQEPRKDSTLDDFLSGLCIFEGSEDDRAGECTHKGALGNITHKKVTSTCNHRMDLKRLIVSTTPNRVAKRLLKRFKLMPRQTQAEQAASAPLTNCNYQCRFYKQFMRMLGIAQSSIPSNAALKRELGSHAVDFDEIVQRREAEENWIRTNDEYVVLELEENKQGTILGAS